MWELEKLLLLVRPYVGQDGELPPFTARRLAAFARRMPKGPQFYVRAMLRHLAEMPSSAQQESDSHLERDRLLERTLDLLAFHDGRSLEALLLRVYWSSRQRGQNADLAVNALAALHRTLRRHPPTLPQARSLLALLDGVVLRGRIAHNAIECRRELLRRFPSLRRPPSYALIESPKRR